jgi:hypothetical protein
MNEWGFFDSCNIFLGRMVREIDRIVEIVVWVPLIVESSFPNEVSPQAPFWLLKLGEML